jgi:hypothetical protein
MGLMLSVLVAVLAAIALGVAVAAVRNGVSAHDESVGDEIGARIAQQRRHSSQAPQRQRSH